MVKHSLLREETAKAKEPVTKTRNKRYTKTRPKKSFTEEPTLPQPKWWQRSSICRLLCCQNVCYSAILYIVLVILLAMFAFAVWRIYDVYLISKSHIPLKESHNWKNNTATNKNNDADSETTEEDGSGHKKQFVGQHHMKNTVRHKLKELSHNTPGRSDHRKFQSNILPKENLSHLKTHVPSSSITKHNNDHDISSSDNPEDLPGDKRYVIPPSPTRFKTSNGLDGSGASEVEKWRAIRYNLLKNRLQLTTGTSYPTENPYWKAWFLSRNNPTGESPFAGSGVSPVHDDNYKSIAHLLESIPSVVVRNPEVRRPLAKHSDIQVVKKKNTTIPNAYSKLLQDVFDKISVMRQTQTTARQTKPSMSTNATLLQLKILSALINKGIPVNPFDLNLRNVNAVGKMVTVRPNIVAASNSTTRRLTTTPTKTTTLSTTTQPTTVTTTATAATKATTMATTTAKITTTAKTTTNATTTTTTSKDTTSGATTTAGRTTHRNAHSHHTHSRRKRRKFNKFHNGINHGPKARHHSHHHHHHHRRTPSGSNPHKKSSIKEPVSHLRTATIDFGSGSDDAESGGGSGSGSGESGSGIEEPRIERRRDGRHKTSNNHQKLHKYVGLRERIKKLKHGKKLNRKLKKRNSHHGSSWAKKKSKDFIGKTRDVIPKERKRHLKGRKKTHHQKKSHRENRPKRKNESKSKMKKSRKSNKHKFMKIIQRKISRMKTKNQIASRLKHVQNKMKEVMKRKNKKKKSHKSQKRNKIPKAERDQTKLLSKPIKRREEPKHWNKGHLSMERCVILKEFDHYHYVGLTKLWKAGSKNTFALTECRRKKKHSNRFRCRRTFYRTRGQMGLKSKRAEKRGKLSLIVCRKKHELKESLNNHSRKEKKASIKYSKEKKVRKKQRHIKKLKRSHRHKKRHHEQSSTKRNSISQKSKRKFHHHRKALRRHRKFHHKFHKRRLRRKKHHKSDWSDTNNDNDYNDDDNSDDFSASDEADDDNGDDDRNGSGSGEDGSGDEEERVERSTNVSDLSHSRTHGKRNYHRRHTHPSHHHYHHHHHQHRRHIELKHSIGKANHTNKTSLISHDNNNNSSQIFTEFVDLMKEMKQEIQNVTALKTSTPSVKLKESITNSSHPTIKALQLSNHTTQIHPHTAKPTPHESVKNISATNSSQNSAMNAGMVHDMVAQLVPAIMKQFEAKSMAIPAKTTKDTKTTSSNSNEKSVTATTKSMHGNTRSTKTAKPTMKLTLKTAKLPTTLTTTKAHPTPHPTNRHFTTPKHMTVSRHHLTKQKSQPHPKTTVAPNLALIIKGLKALGIPSLGQHTSTGKPSQVQKKSVTPSAVDKSKSTLKTAPAPPKQPQLPPPIPKPLQLHNRFVMNILCFGDSLTAGYHDHGKAFTPYGNHLRQLLTYSSKIPVNLKIKGIVGEMTHKQMVSRLPEILGNNTAFDWVIILGGTNDILHVKNFADDQEFLGQLESVWQPRITKDIEKLHTIAHSRNAHTMLLTIPENAIEAWPGYKILLTMRTKINDALRKYANENRNNVALCDLAKKLPRHSLSPQQEALFWDDHLHMTPQGYNRMAEEVFKCLKPYIPKSPTMI